MAIMTAASATILGWPFCIIMTVPLALDSIRRIGLLKVVGWAVVSSLLFLVPSVSFGFCSFSCCIQQTKGLCDLLEEDQMTNLSNRWITETVVGSMSSDL